MLKWVERYGIKAKEENIIITSGATQAIDLAAELLIDSGNYIIVDEFSFLSAIEIFKGYGARFITVKSDCEGIITDGLLEIINKYNPKFIYITPNYNNPTGVTISKKRREKLIKIVNETKTIILEDDSYGELRYEGEQIESIKAIDKGSNVIYISSFSKILSPGIRIGYMIACDEIIENVKKLKENKDIHTNNISQYIILNLLEKDYFNNHLKKIRKLYKEKMDFMCFSLKKYLGESVEFQKPSGGIFLWSHLKNGINSNELLSYSLKSNVSFIPGTSFSTDNSCKGGEFLRLNFSYESIEHIDIGIKNLSKVIREIKK